MLNEAQSAAPAPLRNITPFEELVLEIDGLFDEAANWADGTSIETQQQCDELDRLDKMLLDAGKRLDALRVEEKRPLDEQVQAIQDRYNPYIQPKKGKVDVARSTLNPLRAAWKERERQRKEAEIAKEREEAAAVRANAERLIRESSGNLAARVDAEHMLSSALMAERDVKRAAKAAATGNGLRRAYQVEVENLSVAARHYWADPRLAAGLRELIHSLATDDVRAGRREIPGITITEIRKAL